MLSKSKKRKKNMYNEKPKKYSSIDQAISQAQERLAFYTRRQLESETIVNEINNLLAFLYNLKKECGGK